MEAPPAAATPHVLSAGGTQTQPGESVTTDGAADGSGLQPGAALGNFVIGKQLGQGGMGVVYLARDPDLSRDVALKLLRPDRASVKGQLRREAQVMAQLNHPNIIQVYDIGIDHDNVFVVMEYVEGETLGAWLAGGPRPWREVLARFMDAGRGLVAAHAKGIIHRDFKPSNVLLGHDGRVVVTDFGIARPAEGPHAGGEVAGTPEYMPPEQHRGEPADARSDQFSFCVSLYEALYGERPFMGKKSSELLSAIAAGPALPRSKDIPAWLAPIVLRGLAEDPARRHASMEALLDALANDPAARRRRWMVRLGIATVGAAAATMGFTMLGSRSGPNCGLAGGRVVAVWGDPQRREVAAGFAATRLPRAPAMAAQVIGLLDHHAVNLAKLRVDACRATHERGEQSAELLDLRMHCLDRGVERLAALVDLLRAPDADIGENAVSAVDRLGDLSECARTETLSAVPLPTNPVVRTEIASLTTKLAPINARFDTGKYQDALAASTALLPEIERVNHAPLSAEALFLQAQLEGHLEKNAAAEAMLYRAIEAAARAHDDSRIGRALIALIYSVGVGQHRHAEALMLGRIAESVVVRADDSAVLLGKLHMHLGLVLTDADKLPEARRYYERSYAELRKALGPTHDQVATALNNLGIAAWSEDRLDQALEYFQRGLEAREAALGPEHIEIGDSLTNVAAVLSRQNRFDRAQPLQRRALAIYQASLAPGDPRIATARMNYANGLHELRQYDEARRVYEEALATYEAAYGKDSSQVADVLNNLGNTWRQLHDFERASALIERSLAILTAAYGADHAKTAKALHDLGEVYKDQGRRKEARGYFERALAVWKKTLGEDHPELTQALVSLGDLAQDDGRCRDALPYYTRALALLAKEDEHDPRRGDPQLGLGECLLILGQRAEAKPHLRSAIELLASGDPVPHAIAQFGLARAIGPRDPAAVELARSARAAFLAASDREREREVTAWLRQGGMN